MSHLNNTPMNSNMYDPININQHFTEEGRWFGSPISTYKQRLMRIPYPSFSSHNAPH